MYSHNYIIPDNTSYMYRNEQNNGDNANYRIYAILPQNVVEIIYFTKIVKGDE